MGAPPMLSGRPITPVRLMNRWERAAYRWHQTKTVTRFTGRTVAAPVKHVRRRWLGMTPVYGTLLLWAVAALGHVRPHGWVTVLLVAAFVALPVFWAAGGPCGRFTREVARKAQWWVLGLYASGAVLVTGAAAFGAGPPTPGLLLAWGGLFGWRWWWFWHGHRNMTIDAETMDARLHTWATRIAADGKKLAGALLTEVAPVVGGWSATVNLVRTDLTADDVYKATGVIAARYELPATSVVVEPHPTAANHLARLLVLTHNPLQNPQMFTQLTLDPATGAFNAAVTAEGNGAKWQLWLPNQGGCHGLIFGTTGAGKSGLLNVIFTEAKHSGVVAICAGDPDGGKSMPEWQEHVNVFAGTHTRIRAMLQGLERIMDARRRSEGRHVWHDALGRRRRGTGNFLPTPEAPLLLCVLDEWPEIARDPECLRIVGRLTKKGRKYGISVILLTQVPSLKEMGGSDAAAIRSMISGMNIAAFRTSDKFSDMMGLPMSLPVSPVDLPAKWPDGTTTAGIGYLVRDAGPATVRALFQEDPLAWAMSGEGARIPEAWVEAAGPYFRDWFALLDVEDDDAVELREGLSPRPVEPAEAVTVWAKIAEYLDGQPNGATTNMIVQATGVLQSTVGTTLARRLEKRGDVHKPRDGVWMLGAAPVSLEKAS